MPQSLTQLRDAGRLAVTPLSDEDLMYIAQPAQSPKSRAVKWSALLAELRGAGVATISVDLSTSDVTLDISTNKTEELVILISGTHKLTLSGAPLKNTSITVISAAVAPGSEPRLALSAAYHGPAYLDAKSAAIPFHAAGGFVRYYARPDGTWQGALGVDFGDGSDQVQALASSLAGIFTALTGADTALGNRCTALEGRATDIESVVGWVEHSEVLHIFTSTAVGAQTFSWYCGFSTLQPGTYEVRLFLKIAVEGTSTLAGKVVADTKLAGAGTVNWAPTAEQSVNLANGEYQTIVLPDAVVTVADGTTDTVQISVTVPAFIPDAIGVTFRHGGMIRRLS